ncbi:hypothetical protein [Paenibacillus sp. HW567]|uniref:hypothetical protein n=1 Tax=Paenibacillus sp. HW567 TaxID=1034769 RepID=UPI000381A18C|nr:hypothetical protein [Paenibacillus sp. HW567]
MKKYLLLLLVCLVTMVTGCMNRSTINIQYLDTNETNEIVSKWINSKADNNGIYLGRINNENSVYVYINFKNEKNNEKYTVSMVNIDYQDQELNIKVNPIASDHTFEKVFLVKEKKIKKINLNREELRMEQIEEIK